MMFLTCSKSIMHGRSNRHFMYENVLAPGTEAAFHLTDVVALDLQRGGEFLVNTVCRMPSRRGLWVTASSR